MDIIEIIILILLCISTFLNIKFLYKEKSIKDLYLYSKLAIGKKHYLTVKCFDNDISLVLVDEINNDEYKVDEVLEKGFKTSLFCSNCVFTYNFKKRQEKKT